MKQLTSYERATGYLAKCFKLLNEHYFENALLKPVITIQSSPLTYGHFTPWKSWRIQNKTEAVEINIGAGTLDRPIENVIATLVHEMVHYYCFIKGIKDTSNRGVYHNHIFKEEAEKRGLTITKAGQYGWTVTEPNEDLISFIIENELTEIEIARNDISTFATAGGDKTRVSKTGRGGLPKKPSSTRKYICPCCGTSVRATKEVNIICADCNKTMVKDE
jgi:hypothetical protein